MAQPSIDNFYGCGAHEIAKVFFKILLNLNNLHQTVDINCEKYSKSIVLSWEIELKLADRTKWRRTMTHPNRKITVCQRMFAFSRNF